MKVFIRVLLAITLISGAMINLDSTQASGQLPFFGNNLLGEQAPDFTLPSLRGETVTFSRLRGDKKAIIFFWATWCPHCRQALKELNAETETILQKGIQIVLVDLGESARQVSNYVLANKIKSDILLDEESSLSRPYALMGIPTFVFVDEKGIVTGVEHSMPLNVEEVFRSSK